MKKEQYHRILQRPAIPSVLCIIGKNSPFNETTIQNVLLNSVNYLESKRGVKFLGIMTWVLQSPPPVRDEFDSV